MDTMLTLVGAGVIVAAAGVAATVIIWVLRGVFNLGGLHAKVDALDGRIDELAEGQRNLDAKIDAMQADLHQVINMLTALANHRHDVDGNTVFNVPSNQ